MAKRRRYTDDERATLVAMLAAEGYPDNPSAVRKVASYSKVPERTLRRWYKGESGVIPDKLVHDKKRSLTDRLREAIDIFLEHAIDPDIVGDMSASQAMTSLGIAVDKLQLLTNKPTEISQQTIDITDARERLAHLANRYAATRSTSQDMERTQ